MVKNQKRLENKNGARKKMENKKISEMEREKASYYLMLESEILPFVAHNRNLKSLEIANEVLQKLVRYIEKKFDAVWYIGTDVFGDEIYERFMFHHGGFMEISLVGRIRCYFPEDKIEKMKKALEYALSKTTTSGSASHLIHQIKSGQKLISVKDSILINTELNKGIKKK